MTEQQLRHWLALLRTPRVGDRTLRQLLNTQPDPELLLANPPADAPQALRDWARKPDWSRVDRDLEWLSQPNRRLLPITHPDYPALLRDAPDPPAALFLHGDASLLDQPQLAIVGSRNPSSGGAENAQQFARHLAASGLTVTSGLAIGIDAAAHRGALPQIGRSIAVTGTGLDRVYPASNRELAHQIAEQGLLVSQFLPGTPPRPGHFPKRNHLICGLSLGVLVVEAALRSGSLITAHAAIEAGREVFAIPGSIHNPLARGCHRLIREGAKLVETAQDIVDELGNLFPLLEAPSQPDEAPADAAPDDDYQCLLAALGHEPRAVDQLVVASGLSAESVSSMLLLLELQGHVSSQPGGRYALTRG